MFKINDSDSSEVKELKETLIKDKNNELKQKLNSSETLNKKNGVDTKFDSCEKISDKHFVFDPELRFVNYSFKGKDGYIVFYSDDCGVCKSVSDNLKKKNNNKSIKLGKIDANDPLASKIVEHYNVTTVPCFISIEWKNEKSYGIPSELIKF